mgnify:CR=1 FL=1
MTQAEYAVHRGVGRSAVSNWKKAGLLVFAEGTTGKPEVDVERTDARVNAKIDPARGRPTTAASAPVAELPLAAPVANGVRAGGGESLADVRTDLIRAQTIKAQLDNAKRAGDLVPVEEFTRRAAEYGRVARERMLSVVRSQAEWLASARDARAIVAQLQDEIERAFADLAAQIETGAVPDTTEDPDGVDDALADAAVQAALLDGEGDDDQEATG